MKALLSAGQNCLATWLYCHLFKLDFQMFKLALRSLLYFYSVLLPPSDQKGQWMQLNDYCYLMFKCISPTLCLWCFINITCLMSNHTYWSLSNCLKSITFFCSHGVPSNDFELFQSKCFYYVLLWVLSLEVLMRWSLIKNRKPSSISMVPKGHTHTNKLKAPILKVILRQQSITL